MDLSLLAALAVLALRTARSSGKLMEGVETGALGPRGVLLGGAASDGDDG